MRKETSIELPVSVYVEGSCVAPLIEDDRSESGQARICWCHMDPQRAGFACSCCGCRWES